MHFLNACFCTSINQKRKAKDSLSIRNFSPPTNCLIGYLIRTLNTLLQSSKNQHIWRHRVHFINELKSTWHFSYLYSSLQVLCTNVNYITFMYKISVVTSKLVFFLMRTCVKTLHGSSTYDFVITFSKHQNIYLQWNNI